MHIDIHYIHTYIHTYIHAYMHTYIHTYIHTYTHTYIHTYHAYSLEHVGKREVGNVNILRRRFKHGLLQVTV